MKKIVRLLHLSNNRIKSCGCLTTKSGKKRHNRSNTPLYNVWRAIQDRTSPNYFQSHLYFDKGIRVCREWRMDFEIFEKFALENGYKKGLQIDRIDNNKGYFPENCRFVEPYINVNNRRNTVMVNYKGKEYSLMLLLRDLGLYDIRETVYSRIHRGWSAEDAIQKPIRQGNYK